MNKKNKSFLLSILTLSFIFYSCSNLANDLQKRKNQNLFNITIQETSNGTVTAAKSSGIKAGEEVILSVTATSGYELKTISVTNTQNKDVAVAAMEQGTSYKFTMPASDVTVGADFDKAGPVDITEPGDLNEANGNTTYTIYHYKQTLEDPKLYDLIATQSKRGEAGNLTDAEPKSFLGFTAVDFAQKTISTDGNTIVRIYYDRNIITYTFDPNGGNWDGSTEPVTVSGQYETEVNIPENPDGYGYTFTGWDKSDLQVFGLENQTITARWNADENTSYIVREYLQSVEGGNNYTFDQEYERQGSISAFTPASRYGFNYIIAPLHINSNGNAILNVYWNRESYTVTFNTMGGSEISSQQVLYEATVKFPQAPVKEGYSFWDWYYYDVEGSFNRYSKIRSSITLYALWVDDSITYRLHEDVTQLEAGTDGTFGTTGEYVLFGDYPQSLLDNAVTVDENKTIKFGNDGSFVYGGSDGNLYYKYNDSYYKVEPIKWRVISRDENNIAVLLAESIVYRDVVNSSNYNFSSDAFTVSALTLIKDIYLLELSELLDSSAFPSDNSRIRKDTDFSKIEGFSNWWWHGTRLGPRGDWGIVTEYGECGDYYSTDQRAVGGVVPALSIYLPPEN